MRNRWLTYCGCMCICTAALILYHLTTRKSEASPPGVYCESPDIDLGLIRQGETKEVTYQLTNTSGQTVIIEEILAGCSCIGTTASTMQILDGKSTTISANWDSGLRAGKLNEIISVVCIVNDRKMIIPLRFSADVHSNLTIEPRPVIINSKTPNTQYLNINSLDDKVISIENVSITSKAINAIIIDDNTIKLEMSPIDNDSKD